MGASLDNLTQWTAPPSSLRMLASHAGANAKPEAEEFVPSPEASVHVGDSTAYGWGEGNDDLRQPGERVRVIASDLLGEACLGVEVVLTSHALADEAATLAYMRTGRYDVRPALLLLMHAQDLRALPACLGYGANYLRAWCQRAGQVRSDAVVTHAAADALALVYRPRERRIVGEGTPATTMPATKQRAQELGMRDADYGKLRAIACKAYQRRLSEAEERFRGAPTNTANTAPDPRRKRSRHRPEATPLTLPRERDPEWWSGAYAKRMRIECPAVIVQNPVG